VRAQLIDVGARRVLASAEFDETEVAPSDDPYGGVIAANRALGRLLERLAEFCAETPAAR
jgi:cholesterol transport system auxiliary component